MQIPTFLKWAGGKRKLIPKIEQHLPRYINRYFEPFLGGGSIFFYIKQKYNPNFCLISDINSDLIETYKTVRDNPEELIQYLSHLKLKNSKEFYYEIRKKFNDGKIKGVKRCAVFIYLNKTCFNGLYRVNSSGKFNVPFGKYKNPEIFNEQTIFRASKLLQGVKIICQDYTNLKDCIREKDFIYLDPCYDPLKKTSFAEYTSKRFSDEDNDRLAVFIAHLKSKKVKILFSNNITKNVKRLYPEIEGYTWNYVSCRRSINSIGSKRGEIQELLIKNF